MLVTVCRSVRDGYAPSRHWKQIEEGVLSMLRGRFGPLDVQYDPGLLGGPGGWEHHARPLEYDPLNEH